MTKFATITAFVVTLVLGGCQYEGTSDLSSLLKPGEKIIISKEKINTNDNTPELELMPQKRIIRTASIEISELMIKLRSRSEDIPLGEGRTYITLGFGPSADAYPAYGHLWGSTLTNTFIHEDEINYLDHEPTEITEENGWKRQVKWVDKNVDHHHLHVELLSNEEEEVFFLRSGGIKTDPSFFSRNGGNFELVSTAMPSGEFTYGDESVTVFWEPNGEFWSLEGSVNATVNFDNRLVDVTIESPSILARAEDMELRARLQGAYFSSGQMDIMRYEDSSPHPQKYSGSIVGHLHGSGEGITGNFYVERDYLPFGGAFAAKRNDQ